MNNTHELLLIRKLCAELMNRGVNYCHWKSNAALDRSACGKNDLDLLIDRADSDQFIEILSKLGYKEFRHQEDAEMPGISSYFGYDADENILIHVHAHYKLILGHDFSKNYHIPVEHAYLASATQETLFRVPAPEFEMIIFVIRMIIKHCTWDSILLREGKLSPSEEKEFVYLESKIDPDRITQILAEHFPFIEKSLFDECLSALRPSCPLLRRINISKKILNQLSPYARRNQFMDLIAKRWRHVCLIVQYVFLRNRNRFHLANGGIMIAVVGGDGAGKTTVINHLSQWLSPHFEVKKIHLGKPSWSLSTILIRGILKITTLLRITKSPVTSESNTPYAPLTNFPGFAQAIKALCVAHDRYVTYKQGRRFSASGEIVLCDRFPLPQFIPMDGPQIERMLPSRPNSRLLQRFNSWEQTVYKKIIPPDLLIVLVLDPEIAVERKREEDREFVLLRSSLIWNADWDQFPAIKIDTSHSKEQVFSESKAIVWSKI